MSNQWHTGMFARLPWKGFGALLVAVVGIAGSVAILILSNGAPITQWSVQPTVYLSITSTITNILIHYALTEGVTTAWWTRTLKENTKIVDLHEYWATGNSILSAVFSGRHFNLVALAAISVALNPISGPLLQRASRVVIVEHTSNTMLSVKIAPEIPDGYTGFLEGRATAPTFFSQNFTPVVSDYYDHANILMPDTGCTGLCSTIVEGAGFAVTCNSYQTTYNLSVYDPPNSTTFDTSQPAVTIGTDVFQSYFQWSFAAPSNLSINVQYKPGAGCEGALLVTDCTLMTATVKYGAIIDGNQSSISLPATSTIYDDEVTSLYNTTTESSSGDNTTIGGLYLALSNRFDSYSNMRWTGAIGYTINSTGSTATQFVIPSTIAGASYGQCGLAFTDPTANLLANARELMFRTAVAAANSSNVQNVLALEEATIAVYESHYLYLALASIFTVLAIVLVVPTFSGYWNLGRQVSMSPIEIAKAFNAPLLRNGDSNAEVKQLIEELGGRGARYGAVLNASGSVEQQAGKYEYSLSQFQTPDASLEISTPEQVVVPREGWTFRG